jgi:cell pole-organizing protein PopZ
MAAAQSELSMDEILASIRRIIDEEERPSRPANPDQTNTVDLKAEQEKAAERQRASSEAAVQPAPEQRQQAESAPAKAEEPQSEQLREAQVTAPQPQPKPAAAPVQAQAEPAQAKPEPANAEEAFDPASLKTLAKAKAEAQAARPQEAPQPAKAEEPSETAPKPEASAEKPAAQDDASDDRNLLTSDRAADISKAFAALKSSMQIASANQSRTVETLVEDMLRPMMKAWLDEHLPAIVERKVDAEIRRLTEDR